MACYDNRPHRCSTSNSGPSIELPRGMSGSRACRERDRELRPGRIPIGRYRLALAALAGLAVTLFSVTGAVAHDSSYQRGAPPHLDATQNAAPAERQGGGYPDGHYTGGNDEPTTQHYDGGPFSGSVPPYDGSPPHSGSSPPHDGSPPHSGSSPHHDGSPPYDGSPHYGSGPRNGANPPDGASAAAQLSVTPKLSVTQTSAAGTANNASSSRQTSAQSHNGQSTSSSSSLGGRRGGSSATTVSSQSSVSQRVTSLQTSGSGSISARQVLGGISQSDGLTSAGQCGEFCSVLESSPSGAPTASSSVAASTGPSPAAAVIESTPTPVLVAAATSPIVPIAIQEPIVNPPAGTTIPPPHRALRRRSRPRRREGHRRSEHQSSPSRRHPRTERHPARRYSRQQGNSPWARPRAAPSRLRRGRSFPRTCSTRCSPPALRLRRARRAAAPIRANRPLIADAPRPGTKRP